MAYGLRRKYRRRRRRRRTGTKLSRMYRHTMAFRKIPTGLHLGIHYFKRSFLLATFSSTTTDNEWTFSLNQVAGYTDFTALFDQYQILGIKVQFVPQQNTAEQTSTYTGIIPRIRCHTDRDGGGPYTKSQLDERPHKDLYLDRPRTFYVKAPAVQGEIYRSVSTTAYNPQKYKWIDCAYVDVPHYSLQTSKLDGVVTGWTCKAEATMYLKFKGVR